MLTGLVHGVIDAINHMTHNAERAQQKKKRQKCAISEQKTSIVLAVPLRVLTNLCRWGKIFSSDLAVRYFQNTIRSAPVWFQVGGCGWKKGRVPQVSRRLRQGSAYLKGHGRFLLANPTVYRGMG